MNPETEYREGLEELAEHYKRVLELIGEDTERDGLLKTRGEIQPDGDSEGHRLLLYVRASHAAVLRQGACGIHT